MSDASTFLNEFREAAHRRMVYIESILRRRSHYRAVFNGAVSGEAVLADLKRFCRGMSSPVVISPGPGTQMVDPIATGIAIGRQEVFLRIISHLNMDDAQLLKLKEEVNDDD